MDLTEFLNDPQLISGVSMMQGVPVGQAMQQAQQLSQIRQNMANAKRALELEEKVSELQRRKENLQIGEVQQKLKVHDLKLKLLKRLGLDVDDDSGNSFTGLAGSVASAGNIIPRNQAPAGLADSIQQIQATPVSRGGQEQAPSMAAGDLAALAALEGDIKTAAEILYPKSDTMTPYQAESIRQRELDRAQRGQLASSRGTGGGKAVSPLSYTQLEKAVSGLLGGQPWFEQLRSEKDDPGKLSLAQQNFKNRVVTAALSNLRKDPSLPVDAAITTGFEEVYKDVRVRSDDEGNPVFDYSPRLNKDRTSSGPSQEDIEYTARKHGITPEEVISRLKAAGKI